VPSLVRHPDAPPGAIRAIDGELARIDGGAVATFRAVGNIARLVIPPPAPAVRTDGLWRTSCFELFAGTEGPTYREFNLSPSGAFAAYHFDGYRQGMREAEARIAIETSHDDRVLTLKAVIRGEFALAERVGLAAVIEESDGIIRYWASAFAPGKPDFHAAAVRSLLFDGVSAT